MIISDSTTIITLINIDEFRVLKLFIDSIIIPHEVYDEICKKPSAKKFLDKEIKNKFISIESYDDKSLFKQINYILDSGESASITMAIERELPLIIDEKKGRKFAKLQGVEIIGLVGILRFLYIEKRLNKDEILKIVEKLNDSDFRISPSFLELILL